MSTYAASYGRIGSDGFHLLRLARITALQLRRWARVRRDRAKLQTLPDYLLADIGLSRGHIDQALIFGRVRD